MTSKRTPLSPVITSLLMGAGQGLAVVLAVLPILVPDADIPRFLFRATIASLTLQIFGFVLALSLGTMRCPWVKATRFLMLILSFALLWTYGWGDGTLAGLSAAIVVSFVLAAGIGTISELVLGIAFAVAAFGVGHPLLLVDLVPAALLATWGLYGIRVVLWWLLGLAGHNKDIAVVALVGGLIAPTIMWLGGFIGHDTALLTSAFITQIIGFVAARWVCRAVSQGSFSP